MLEAVGQAHIFCLEQSPHSPLAAERGMSRSNRASSLEKWSLNLRTQPQRLQQPSELIAT
jgi:hypothetical protein